MNVSDKCRMSQRRDFLCSAAAGSALALAPGLVRGAPRTAIDIWGPPVGPSIVLAHLAESDTIQDTAPGSLFKPWRTPDQMRAGMTSGNMKINVVPTYTGANLYNRGLPVKMVNVMTWGLLYLMSTDDGIQSLEDIAGKKINVPFRNDMPDLILRHVASAAGLQPDKDFELMYTATPPEAVQFLLAGRADSAVLPEPLATAAFLRGLKASVSVNRALDLQTEWGKATGRAPFIPQAGAIVHQSLLDENPDFVRVFQEESKASTDWVNNNPVSAGNLAQDYLGIGAPVIEKSIPFSNLRAVNADDAREDLAFFFETLARQSKEIIGGRLPRDDFYLSL